MTWYDNNEGSICTYVHTGCILSEIFSHKPIVYSTKIGTELHAWGRLNVFHISFKVV